MRAFWFGNEVEMTHRNLTLAVPRLVGIVEYRRRRLRLAPISILFERIFRGLAPEASEAADSILHVQPRKRRTPQQF